MDRQRYGNSDVCKFKSLLNGLNCQRQNPEYEEVMASRNEGGHDALEMMQNVAYGPLQL